VKEAKTYSSLVPKEYCHSKLQESWNGETCANYGQMKFFS